MYFGLFFFALVMFLISIPLSRSFKGESVNDMSEIDAYLHKYNIFMSFALLLVVASVILCLLPIIDANSVHGVKEVVPATTYTSSYTKTVYETKIFHLRSEYESDITFAVWYHYILLVASIITLLVYVFQLASERTSRTWEVEQKMKEEEERKEKERLAKEAEEKALSYIRSNYGQPEKIIHTTPATPPDWDKTVFFVFDNGYMCYDNKAIKFSEFIDCKYVDDSTVTTKLTGKSDIEMSTNSGSLIGRSVVGGLLGGEAGAIIGGATASKSGTAYTESTSVSKTKHDYTIIVNTKNMREPLVKIPCGEQEQAVHEIVATVSAIIANNK